MLLLSFGFDIECLNTLSMVAKMFAFPNCLLSTVCSIISETVYMKLLIDIGCLEKTIILNKHMVNHTYTLKQRYKIDIMRSLINSGSCFFGYTKHCRMHKLQTLETKHRGAQFSSMDLQPTSCSAAVAPQTFSSAQTAAS